MDWNTILTNLLIAAITVFVPVIGTITALYLKRKLVELNDYAALNVGQSQWYFATTIIRQFVEAAEQRGVWDDLLKQGQDKKTWVLGQVDQILKGYGIDLDEASIDAAIEQAVGAMKWPESSEMS